MTAQCRYVNKEKLRANMLLPRLFPLDRLRFELKSLCSVQTILNDTLAAVFTSLCLIHANYVQNGHFEEIFSCDDELLNKKEILKQQMLKGLESAYWSMTLI